MHLLPLVERELRAGARRPSLYWLRTATVVMATLLGLLLLMNAVWLNPALAGGGALLFNLLTASSFGMCLLSGPLLAADCLAGERRSGTLDLMFLADVRGWEIIAAKFAALTLPALHVLLASVPVMAMAFFIGGVSGPEFVRAEGALLNTLFLSLSVTVALSAVFREGATALAVALAVLLGWNVAVPAVELAWWAHHAPNTVPTPVMPCPSYALLFANEMWAAANPDSYEPAMMRGQVVGWISLIGAAAVLPGIWRRGIVTRRRWPAWRTRRGSARAKRLRDGHPLLWLASRHASHSAGPWLTVLLSAPALLVSARMVGQGQLAGLPVLLSLASVQLVLKLWVAWSASRGFADDRETGALELLLVTPLDQRDLWRARLAVLKRQFLGPVLALATANLVLMFVSAGRQTSDEWSWHSALLILFVWLLADTYTLSWVALRQSLSATTATLAFARAILWVLVLPDFLMFLLAGALGVVADDPSEFALLFLASGFAIGLLADVTACVLAMIWVSDGFRAAASGEKLAWRRR